MDFNMRFHLSAWLLLCCVSIGLAQIPSKETPDKHQDNSVRMKDASSDTMTYMWRSSIMHCIAAEDSGWAYPDSGTAAEAGATYDKTFVDSDGSFMRYGTIHRDKPTTLHTDVLGLMSGAHHEYTATAWPENLDQISFLKFDLSRLPDECEIVDAYLVASVLRYGGIGCASGYYATVRLDTVMADLAMFEAQSATSDPRELNMSWIYSDIANVTEWSPPMDERLQWCRFGMRSRTKISPRISGDATPTRAVRFDVKDQVQWFVDSGREANGAFVLYGTDLRMHGISCDGAAGGYGFRNGCPQLVVEFVTPGRPERPWGGLLVPVVITMDDGQYSHPDFKETIVDGHGPGIDLFGDPYMASTGGACYSEVLPYNYWCTLGEDQCGTRAYCGDFQDMYCLPDVDWVLHTNTHVGLGAHLGVLNDIYNDLERSWVLEAFGGEVDTASVEWRDFAWPIATPTSYSLRGIGALVDMGYRSARLAGGNIEFSENQYAYAWNDSIGIMSYLSWENLVNMYGIKADMAVSLFGSTYPGMKSDEALKSQFLKHLDYCYSTHGKSAAIYFWHSYLADTSDGYSYGPTKHQLAYLKSIIDGMDGVELRTFEDVVSMRLDNSQLLTPSEVLALEGLSGIEAAAAAMYDSLVCSGESGFNKVFAAPASFTKPNELTSIEDEGRSDNQTSGDPTCQVSLFNNYPNPVASSGTRIRFMVPDETMKTELSVFDLRGRLVQTLLSERLPKGEYLKTWDARDSRGVDVASGVYFYRLKVANKVAIKKLVVVR
jgi:hypothetical protein